MYERLTNRQKDLLRDIVNGVQAGKVREPFQGNHTHSGSSIIGIGKDYDLSLKGDLKVLDDEGFLSSTYISGGDLSYTLLQTAYSAIDQNFQDASQEQSKVSRNIQNNEAFIICAFRDELNPICKVIKSVAHKHEMTARRVDEFEEDFQITEKIIQQIEEAKIIIADLSFERPNVYFEYGYARGAGRTGSIITLLRQGQNAHFDVKDWNQIVYNPDNLEALEQNLANRFTAMLSKQE